MNFIEKAFADDIEPVTNATENVIVEEVPPAQNTIYSFLPIIVIFAVFYFFMIRPQVKQQKQHKTMLSALKKGDKIITNSGILGSVVKVEEGEYVQVEIAQNTKIRMLKTSVAQVTTNIINPSVDDKKENNKKLEQNIEEKKENFLENSQEIEK